MIPGTAMTLRFSVRAFALVAGFALIGPPAVRAQASLNESVASASIAGGGGGGGGGRKSTRRRAVKSTRAVAALRYTSPRSESALSSDLSTLLHSRVRKGTWGVMVVSLTRGDTLFSENADALLQPASTMKLFTTALAFERLGPAHSLTTEVLRDGQLAADGTLAGDLILRGGGDPSFSNRFIPGDPNAPMRVLAHQVAIAGVRRITGDVIGDATAFESKRIPDGWLARYINDSYAQRVSALSLNENLLHVVVSPGSTSGILTLQPGTTAYRLVNTTRTIAGSRGARLVVAPGTDGTIYVKGWIGSRSVPRVYVVVVEDPATFATGAFRNALEAEGISVSGTIRLGATPAWAERVTALSSPPLWQLASIMNRESVNHFAELLFRDAARTGDPAGVGSAAMGNTMLQQFMVTRAGARTDAVFAADGSGLSSLDRITARSMVQLLSYANRAPWSREFHESLPVAGESELLRRRMRGTPARGNLHAKTGTTNDVISLGGYVTSQSGETLAFAFVYNGRERWTAKETIDAMGPTLAAFTR